MLLVILCFVATECQYKSLSFYYGFGGLGPKCGDPKYEMSAAFPELHAWYGLLSGFIYDVPYSLFGLLSGYLCTTRHRVAITGILMILLSSTQVLTGVTTSFFTVVLMRFLHSVYSSS